MRSGKALDYRVRFLGENMAIESEITKRHADDTSAISEAVKLAGGRGVEVWRGMQCVYRDAANPINDEPWAA
jgi:hypothetical protein